MFRINTVSYFLVKKRGFSRALQTIRKFSTKSKYWQYLGLIISECRLVNGPEQGLQTVSFSP